MGMDHRVLPAVLSDLYAGAGPAHALRRETVVKTCHIARQVLHPNIWVKGLQGSKIEVFVFQEFDHCFQRFFVIPDSLS